MLNQLNGYMMVAVSVYRNKSLYWENFFLHILLNIFEMTVLHKKL